MERAAPEAMVAGGAVPAASPEAEVAALVVARALVARDPLGPEATPPALLFILRAGVYFLV